MVGGVAIGGGADVCHSVDDKYGTPVTQKKLSGKSNVCVRPAAPLSAWPFPIWTPPARCMKSKIGRDSGGRRYPF